MAGRRASGRLRPGLGLQARMALFFAGLLLLVNLVVLTTQRRPIVGAFEDGLRLRGRELALNLSARARDGVLAGSTERLRDLLESFHEFQDVSAVEIRRDTGGVLAAVPPAQGPERPGRPAPGTVEVSRDTAGLRFRAAIPGTDAVARIELRRSGHERTIAEIGLTIAGIAAAAVGAGFLFVLVAVGAFVRPVQRLVELARRIRGGDLGARVAVGRGDELGELAEAMNAMSTDLREQDAELRDAVRATDRQNEELRRRGRELTHRTRQLETVVASLAEGVLHVGMDRVVAVVNQAAARILGETSERLRGRALPDLGGHTHGERLRALLEEALGHADRGETYRTQECLADLLHTVTTVHGPDHEPIGVLAVLQDLSRIRDLESEQQELRDQLYHQEKMAVVGLLAASLAHELNTPLATILLQTQRVARELGEKGSDGGLEVVEQQVRRCRDIVRRLLDFSRAADSEPAQLDLATVLESSISLAQAGVRREGISIRRFVAHDAPRVWADAHQIEQVLMNLIWNAVDAMPDGGYIDLRLGARNGGAELVVCDQGPGIPEECRERVFEPFYTTKPRGCGTGLGLSICRRIIEAHQGSIEIRGGRGGGTDVALYLPAAGEGDV